MRLWLLFRRIATVVCAAACVLFLLTLAIVQVGQRLVRHRAERLLVDLKEVHVNVSTWPDLQRLMTEWGAFGSYEGTCTEQQCEYRIDLEDWLAKTGRATGAAHYAVVPMAPFVRMAHWHMPSLWSQLTVHDGRIVLIRTIFEVDVAKGSGPTNYDNEYALIASISSLENHHEGYFPWPLLSPHPTYGVGTPSGCMGCMSIRTTYGPSIAPQDMDRLMDVNLDCMTRWKPCTVEADIHPFAWGQFKADNKLRHEMRDRAETCNFTAEEMAQGSDLVLRVLLTTDEERAANPGHWQMYQAKVLETMKGETPWKAGASIQLEAEWLNRKANLLSASKGTELIIFDPYPASDGDDVLPIDCGTVLSTPETLARTRAAIGLSRRP